MQQLGVQLVVVREVLVAADDGEEVLFGWAGLVTLPANRLMRETRRLERRRTGGGSALLLLDPPLGGLFCSQWVGAVVAVQRRLLDVEVEVCLLEGQQLHSRRVQVFGVCVCIEQSELFEQAG